MQLLVEIPGWEAIETTKQGRIVYRPINGVSEADLIQRVDLCRDGMVAFLNAIGMSPYFRFGGDA